MTDWFTSDSHYWHKNIIKYCNRPFSSVEEMNETMIRNWNSVVQPDDTVYHIGDFGFSDPKQNTKILSRLVGHKHLIKGNHDKGIERTEGFESISTYKEIYVGDQFLILCHYCFSVFNRSHHGSMQIFGHSHGNHSMNQQQIDAGVDVWNFFPVTLEQIKAKAKTLPPMIRKDHHE